MDGSPTPLVVSLCLRAAAADSPGVEALVDGSLRLTYADLAARAEEFARALIAAGVRQGEVVALWAPNSATWVISALGAFAAGAVLVPVNTRYRGAEARYLLAKARAVLLIVDNGFLENDYLGMLRAAGPAEPDSEAGELLPGLPFLRAVVTLRPDADPVVVSYESFLEGAAMTVPEEVDKRIDALTPGTLCDIVFTSGTVCPE